MNLEEMNDDQILEEAKKQGYNPNFEGEGKKTPKEFLEVAFTHNHVLKERNDKLSEQLAEITKKFDRNQELTQKLVADIEAQKKKAVEKAIKKLESDRRDAITEGDVEKVEALDKEIDEHKQDVVKKQENTILDTWIDKNPWYQDDEEMGIEADLIAESLGRTGRFQGEDGYKRMLSEVEKRVKKAFPEKFSNPKKDLPPEVESGRPSSAKKSKKTYEDLPIDARQACDEFVTAGIMTKDQYVNAYEWE